MKICSLKKIQNYNLIYFIWNNILVNYLNHKFSIMYFSKMDSACTIGHIVDLSGFYHKWHTVWSVMLT